MTRIHIVILDTQFFKAVAKYFKDKQMVPFLLKKSVVSRIFVDRREDTLFYLLIMACWKLKFPFTRKGIPKSVE